MKAPWPDFKGNDIHEGDTMVHPSGESGVVLYLPDSGSNPNYQWFIDYGDSGKGNLCLQIGDKGQATVHTQRIGPADGSVGI